MLKCSKSIAAAVAAAALVSVPVARAEQFINVLTGGTSGVYYPLGVAIGKIYSDRLPNLRTQVQATKASVENLILLQQDLVEIQVGDQQAVEDMQARIEHLEPVLQPANHGRLAEFQPLEQHLLQAHHARAPVESDDVEIDAVVSLEIGRREQVRHQRVGIDAIALRHDDQAGRLFVI